MKIKMLTAALGLSVLASHANVLITEYVEGGSSNKAIEISNLGSTEVDLAAGGYKIDLYSNGKTESTNGIALQGLLIPGSSIVVYNNSATDAFKFDAPQGMSDASATFFNGDDALILSNAGGVIDSFGQLGTDPGSNWGEGDFATKDHTLRRKVSITQGDTTTDDAFEPSTEWSSFAKDTADGLGCTGEAACDGSQPLPTAGTVIGNTSPPTDELCTNCPDLAKIADRATYLEATYYANANAADAAALRAAITKDISAVHKKLSYSEVWTALTYTDEDPAISDNIILLYSGRSIAKKDNGSGSASSNQDFWNREHTWAKSHGFPETSQLGYTDIHHLRPTDISINSARGNRDFGIGGTSNVEAPANMSTADTWEPRDEVKGDVARMMFYMDVRYDAGTEVTMPDLILVDSVGTATSTLSDGTGELGKLCTLFDWHSQDPVDSVETNRNHSIYEYQGNRNPFIDHPEWVNSLYASACGESVGSTDGDDANEVPSVPDIDANEAPTVSAGDQQSVASAASVSLTATATDSDGSIASYAWMQTSGKMATITNADIATVTFVTPKVGKDESLVFTVTVTDDLGKTATASVTINVAAEVIDIESTGGTFYLLLAGLTLLTIRRFKNLV